MTEITTPHMRANPARGTSGGRGDSTRARCRGQLVVDPSERLLQAHRERSAGLPAEALADQGVVGIPPAHALRRVEVVAAPQADAGDLLDRVDELVDRHQL